MAADDPDLALWQALQRGEESALDALMERHREGLFRFAFRYVVNEDDAREIVQETFVRAYFKRHQFHPKARVLTWLYRIALNFCRDRARSHAGRQERLTSSLDEPTDDGEVRMRDVPEFLNPADIAQTNEAMRVMERAIQSLPHDLKTVLILAALEDRPQKECAELLGITVKAVETRLYRARKLLEGKLAGLRL